MAPLSRRYSLIMSEKDNSISEPAEHSIEQMVENASSGSTNRHWVNKEWIVALVSFILLSIGLVLDHWIRPIWFHGSLRFAAYAIAYLPVALPVITKGSRLVFKGEVFTEFTLMTIATAGALYIGEYPEAVAVMLFYAIGELFQGAAVSRAKGSIKSLLDVRPERASVLRKGIFDQVDPSTVRLNEIIQVKVGERVPLDGTLLSEASSFNTSALTGESRPRSIEKGDSVLAGMINESRVAEMKVTRLFDDSSLARILTLVQHAQGRKAKTELLIRRFANVYTPIVVFLAVAITLVPYFFAEVYVFNEWLYRALIFLVISCPCALVVAIPLGYFGGIGAGSRNGILFKGSSFLDRLTRVDTVVFDKTGTLTKGVFKVQEVVSLGLPSNEWLPMLSAVESHSNHSVAKAIVQYAGHSALKANEVQEITGHGVLGNVNGREIIAGNRKMIERFNIGVDDHSVGTQGTVVIIAVDRKLSGYITIADELKEDAAFAIDRLHSLGIRTFMLSGDRQTVVDEVARSLKIDEAFGDLLPESKVEMIEGIKKGKEEPIAFVGDGINDAPVIAVSDVGIAMGGLGSDAAIETADIVIQTDQPSRIVTAIRIGKATNRIVWQNIALAFAVKIAVMALGAWGMASMWEAVFADVGVALLAILNAVRIQRMKFE